MTLTFKLIAGGYHVYSADGLVNIYQPYAPGESGYRQMGPDEATTAAEALIAELTLG